MGRREFGFLLVLVLVFLMLPFVSSVSIENEIQKITHYAEEYETGNINYVQLLLHTSAVREKLNEELGVVSRDYGGTLKQEQIRSILGEPIEETKWVWVEGLDHEIKLDEPVPVWKKIVFDGKKIQIKLDAYPSVFYRKLWDVNYEDYSEEEIKEFERLRREELKNKEFGREDIIYRLHFNIEFKRPENQINIPNRIDQAKSLAEDFNSNPSRENGEKLAKNLVETEKLFWNYFEQTQGKCIDTMKDIFGEENQRETQNLFVQEIDFYEGDNFEAIARLEMCDDCEWSWINLNIHIEGRGRGFEGQKQENFQEYNKDSYSSFSDSEFETRIREVIQEIMLALENNDPSKAYSEMNKLNMLNQAWNEQSNNVWQKIDVEFALQDSAMTEEQRHQMHEDYGWIKREQQRRQRERELKLVSYEKRKQFYLNLFEPYDKKEFYFTQVQFEKRLIQEFQVQGKEICDNNVDDNNNGQVDCQEDQCGGQFCGKVMQEVSDGNVTKSVEKELYCISGSCQLKQEEEEEKIICGNHICEEGETILNCVDDCSICPEHPPLNCSGKVIFSGEDKNGCQLEPICLEEIVLCSTTEDCTQPLCGVSECIRMEPEDDVGKCEVTELKECQEEECVDGEERFVHCASGEKLVDAVCVEGVWNEVEAVCSTSEEILTTVEPDEGIGEECVYQTDCGGENDVCSNGNCVTIPQSVQVETEEIVIEVPEPETGEDEETVSESEVEEEPFEEPGEKSTPPEQEPPQDIPSEEAPITGEAIGFLKRFTTKLFVSLTGSVVEEELPPEETPQETPQGTPSEEPPQEPDENTGCPDPGEPPQVNENCWYKQTYDDRGCVSGYDVECGEYTEDHKEEYYEDEGRDNEQRDRERREDEDNERREKECGENCERNCYDSEIRPCAEECIWDSCGDELDCDVDDERVKCESNCKQERNFEGCINDCVGKCSTGEQYWEEGPKPEQEKHKFEKGVFQVGGECRTTQGKTESHLWFGGWGEPFDQIEPLKQKYYNTGGDDWCKYDLENLIKQRQEFEEGFNQEFVEWFFEKYLANSAEDWEQHLSGIFELYWANVDNLRQMSERMDCLGIEEIPTTNLIGPLVYESDFGRIEYWEELKVVKMRGPEGEVERIMVTPYMKSWIFPPKEFLIYEMQSAMEEGQFPGSPEKQLERDQEEGLTSEEKEGIKQDSDFMRKIRNIAEKYGGNLDVSAQLVDYETGQVVFNIYVQVNEEDIFTLQPMPPEQVPAEDAKVILDFDKVYEMVYSIEKEMKEDRVESPPWDRSYDRGGIKDVTQGIKIFFKVRDMINSAEVEPKSAESDIKSLLKTFLRMAAKMGAKEGMGGEEGEMNQEGMEGPSPEGQVDEAVWDEFEKEMNQ